jgi:hypothetical protein
MFFTIFCFGAFAAFISLLEKEFLNDFPVIRNGMRRHLPFIIRQPFLCGFCFTSWIALGTTIVAWQFLTVPFLVAWASIAITALILRSIIIAFQELICWATHTLNKRPDDVH